METKEEEEGDEDEDPREDPPRDPPVPSPRLRSSRSHCRSRWPAPPEPRSIRPAILPCSCRRTASVTPTRAGSTTAMRACPPWDANTRMVLSRPRGTGGDPPHPYHPSRARGDQCPGRGDRDLLRRRGRARGAEPPGRFLRGRVQREEPVLRHPVHRVRALRLQRLLPHALREKRQGGAPQRHGSEPLELQLRRVGAPARMESPPRVFPRHLATPVLPARIRRRGRSSSR